MDDKTITLVQESFAKVEPIKATAAELFYSDLFATAPEVRPLFNGNMNEQGMKLMPAAQALAIRHVDYGVQPEHYDKVGASLIRTLEQGLGPDFTSDVRTAWIEAYTTLSSVMKQAAYPKEALQ